MIEVEPCVTRVPVFQGLTRPEQERIAALARPLVVEAGEVLSSLFTRPTGLFVVHEGALRVSRISANGQEQVLRLAGVGDVVGESSFVTGRPSGDQVEARTRTRVCSFDPEGFAELVRGNPDIAWRMLRTVTERLRSTERLLTAVTSSDVGARVAAYLLDLDAPDGLADLPMTKREIASLLGTSPETLSRRLASFADVGIIDLVGRRGVRILNRQALEIAATPE